jgi:hypothetical protein
MLKTLLSTTALALISFGTLAADLPVRTTAAAPDAATQGVSGYLGMSVGGTGMSWSNPSFLEYDTEYPKGNAVAFGALGAANMWLSNSVSLQVSADAEGTSGYKSNDGTKESRFSGVMGTHLAYRDPSSHAYGIFAGVTGLNSLGYNGSNNGGIVGIEAQKYFGALTLYGQAGYGDQFNDAGHTMLQKYWFVRGITRYFIDPNLQVSAELGYTNGPAYENGDKYPTDVLNWSLGIEHRLDRSPLSIFASYQGDRSATRTAGCKRENVVQTTVMVGVKINFGAGTLQANDRNGATFNLPKLHRSMALVDGLEDSSYCVY